MAGTLHATRPYRTAETTLIVWDSLPSNFSVPMVLIAVVGRGTSDWCGERNAN